MHELPLEWRGHAGGEFKRQPSTFRKEIKKGGEYPPEKGRYSLIVSLACPWAHRTLIVRKLKGLEKLIGQFVWLPRLLQLLNNVHMSQMSSPFIPIWQKMGGLFLVSTKSHFAERSAVLTLSR